MPDQTYKTVDDVVRNQLCCCCGTCISICPQQAIEMTETASGLLVAHVEPSCCNHCGLCIQVCPGIGIKSSLLPEAKDPFEAINISSYLGHSNSAIIRKNGQSGGLATTILLHLLNTKQIDRAIVTIMPENGSLRPLATLTNNAETILNASGSKYCPVALNEKLRHIKANEKIAIVGLPCHFHGIKKIEKHLPPNVTIFKIGLICDRILTFNIIDHLIYKAFCSRYNARHFRYRDKEKNGWPGDICITTWKNKKIFLPSKHRMQCKEYYTPYRCRLCFDKLNSLADIVLGDPHGILNDSKGVSICIARNNNAKNILANMPSGEISLFEIDYSSITKGQRIVQKKIEYQSNMTFAQANNLPFPLPLKSFQKSAIIHNKRMIRSYSTGKKNNKLYIITKSFFIIFIMELQRKYSFQNITRKLKEILSK